MIEPSKQFKMRLAAEANKPLLDKARQAAEEIGRLKGVCSMDDVRDFLGWHHDLPNFAGYNFRGGPWIYQEHIKSRNPKANGRQIILWKYSPSVERREAPSDPAKVETAQRGVQLNLI